MEKFGHFIKVRDIFFVLFFTTFVVFANFVLVPYRSFGVRLPAFLLMAVSIYPLWRYMRRPGKDSLFMIMISTIYSAYFALPLLMPFDFYILFRNVPEEAHIEALWLSVIGVLLMLLTFYLFPRKKIESWCPKFPSAFMDRRHADNVAVVMGIFGLLSTLAGIFLDVPLSVSQFSGMFNLLSLLSIAILLHNQLTYKLSFFYKIFLLVFLIPIQLMIDLSSGLLFTLVRDASVILMTYMLVKKRVPWGSICVSSCVFVLLLLSKSQFRALTWKTERNASSSIPSKALTYGSLLLESVSSYDADSTSKGLESIVNRLDFHSIFADVVYLTPNDVSYWGGETYVPLFTRFIPRALWPDKPMELTGQNFGHRYSILDDTDLTTSLNTPQIVELYANFGSVGVILGMAFMGFLYKLLFCVIEHKNSGPWNSLVGIVIYSSLLSIDSNFSLTFGNVIPSLIFFHFIGRAVFPNPVGTPRRKVALLSTRPPA